jgi:hypothetical protein
VLLLLMNVGLLASNTFLCREDGRIWRQEWTLVELVSTLVTDIGPDIGPVCYELLFFVSRTK